MIAPDLLAPLTLPCGTVLLNRIAKSAMPASLGDGLGELTDLQTRLDERWAKGGVGLSIAGEVQADPNFAEKPGNLALGPHSTTPVWANWLDTADRTERSFGCSSAMRARWRILRLARPGDRAR